MISEVAGPHILSDPLGEVVRGPRQSRHCRRRQKQIPTVRANIICQEYLVWRLLRIGMENRHCSELEWRLQKAIDWHGLDNKGINGTPSVRPGTARIKHPTMTDRP